MIKEKLQSQRGASMLMAMVFLLFSLLIGGSVLAAATANSSRIAHLVGDQQEYLSQRSALAVMADMLTPQTGETLKISFAGASQIAVDIPASNFRNGQMPVIQQILYDIVIDHYYDPSHNLKYSIPGWSPTFGRSNSGTVQVSFGEETLDAIYAVTFNQEGGTEKTCVLEIKFAEDSRVRLVMVGNINTTGDQITIGWSLPSIQKGGA